ncbi:Crp/Fnr family transcriptional regulator [Sinomicrobium pectinilyticum]|uniref:Crp/Fnr family transcriptional regulator n=1 Tax=Sinomicrobium pectinilyticum TaxID=1084421 RepID=A0A3N0DPP3_SINP1|nr:Crp/Fnr family transcriptional regulator [Sinomicrobium pectinilyticum]RNL77416.1 Crp/Fnr family transcriptional regulator [Sinomicrobium pectinilyticum]
MITTDLLLDNGAELISYDKGEVIFRENQRAQNYYQILSGKVKMNNFTSEGKEFIQGIFSDGESFGEPPLFADVTYPANAEALTGTRIYRLSGAGLFRLLVAYPEEHLKISRALAQRLYYKAIMANELSGQEPEHRILRILDYLKKEVYGLEAPFSFKVNLTRQQIADLTGLRVETVIRAGKCLEQKGAVKIVKRKLYR